MTDYDMLLVNSETGLQILETPDEGLLVVDANTETQIIVPVDAFEILNVALQGVPGPTGPQGVTIFTDISAIAVREINTRLAAIDQITTTITDTTETANFSTVYQLHV